MHKSGECSSLYQQALNTCGVSQSCFLLSPEAPPPTPQAQHHHSHRCLRVSLSPVPSGRKTLPSVCHPHLSPEKTPLGPGCLCMYTHV